MSELDTIREAIKSGDVSKARKAFDLYRAKQDAHHARTMAEIQDRKRTIEKQLRGLASTRF